MEGNVVALNYWYLVWQSNRNKIIILFLVFHICGIKPLQIKSKIARMFIFCLLITLIFFWRFYAFSQIVKSPEAPPDKKAGVSVTHSRTTMPSSNVSKKLMKSSPTPNGAGNLILWIHTMAVLEEDVPTVSDFKATKGKGWERKRGGP